MPEVSVGVAPIAVSLKPGNGRPNSRRVSMLLNLHREAYAILPFPKEVLERDVIRLGRRISAGQRGVRLDAILLVNDACIAMFGRRMKRLNDVSQVCEHSLRSLFRPFSSLHEKFSLIGRQCG